MSHLTISNFLESDLENFLKLSHGEYGYVDSNSSDHIAWKHLNSPFGASTLIKLSENNDVVGHALMQPRLLQINGKKIRCALVMDVLIDRNHRTTPAKFIELTKAAGNVDDIDLVIHTSNNKTGPLYSKLFRFPSPFSLTAFGFPVKLSGFLTLILGRRIRIFDWFLIPFHLLFLFFTYVFCEILRLDISNRPTSDVELNNLSDSCVKESGPQLVRSNEFLKWRFNDAPLWSASIFRIERCGHFLGYVVTRKVKLGDLNHQILMDFLINPETPSLVNFAIRLWLISHAIKSGSDTFFTMINFSNTSAKQFIGFPLAMIPEKFLPHTTPIFIRSSHTLSKIFESDTSIHITLSDLDYF
jgi:hypothetical protein